MKITICQMNPLVGDLKGNAAKIKKAVSAHPQSDLIIFPELCLTGYPPKDLLEREHFMGNVAAALGDVVSFSRKHSPAIIIGLPEKNGNHNGTGLYNSAFLIRKGRIIHRARKTLLPTYDVFDEARYFDSSPENTVFELCGKKLGITICEDAWYDAGVWGRKRYCRDPVSELAEDGAEMVINISASPFFCGKEKVRHGIMSGHAKRHGISFVYVNQVGGNDELIFDGRSMFFGPGGETLNVLPSFEECEVTTDTEKEKPMEYAPEPVMKTLHDALVLGLRDYMRKSGFGKAVVGLSGGIDSAVTCVLAAEALGHENVLGVSMPSMHSSAGSVDDSEKLAGNLGIGFRKVPIKKIYDSYIQALAGEFSERGEDVTEENIQARIRGDILMAFSNKFGHMVLSTGNKSELAVGYCTLYGDMSGGLSVISDVPKTMVYELARYINRQREVIPREIIGKAPSAELRPDQKDEDFLPPYDILDSVLYHYLEEMLSAEDIVRKGFAKDTVRWIIEAVNRNEYKRRQAAPGLKVTTKAFGVGRRMPIAARYDS